MEGLEAIVVVWIHYWNPNISHILPSIWIQYILKACNIKLTCAAVVHCARLCVYVCEQTKRWWLAVANTRGSVFNVQTQTFNLKCNTEDHHPLTRVACEIMFLCLTYRYSTFLHQLYICEHVIYMLCKCIIYYVMSMYYILCYINIIYINITNMFYIYINISIYVIYKYKYIYICLYNCKHLTFKCLNYLVNRHRFL